MPSTARGDFTTVSNRNVGSHSCSANSSRYFDNAVVASDNEGTDSSRIIGGSGSGSTGTAVR
ncbi:hypothetical protein FALCPG4_018251 [Fusarium falciforme]